MSTRKIKDAKDLSTNELIYFKGHAQATYMSDGRTVEDAVNNIAESGADVYVWDMPIDSSSGTVTPETYDALCNAPKIVLNQDNGAEIEMTKMIHEGTILLYTLQTTMTQSDDANYMYIVSMYYYINPDYTYLKTGGMCVIPTGVNLYSKPSNGIPKSDLANDVQTSLNKADTALQSYTEQYKGTVTSVKINGVTKNQSSGVVDLGYINKQLSTSTSSSMTLSPNIYYRNTNTSLSTLTITLGSVSNSNILNEYFVEFTTRSSGTTISLPSSIKWANGVTPTFENGKTYQISIVNNLGTCVKFG